MESAPIHEKLIAVMQPTFFPWIGYFDLIDQADVFVIYNDVQFSKQSWQTRNRISSANGIVLINIPVLKSELDTPIFEIAIDNRKPWNKKLVKTFFYNYQRAAYFDEVHPWFENFMNTEFVQLQDLNSSFIMEVSKKMGIQTEFVFSRDLQLGTTDRVERLIELSKHFQAKIYLSTTGAYGYLNEEHADDRFRSQNVRLEFHHYKPVTYATGKLPFEPYMSALDVLYHCGFSGALEIVRAGRKQNFIFDEYKQMQHE